MAEKAAVYAKTSEQKQKNSSLCKQESGINNSGFLADRILHLQRTAGNQAVQRLIRSGVLQAKLKIGQPNDMYEQEADRVAEQVMRMPEPQVQRKCANCNEDEKKILQAKAIGSIANTVPPIVHEVLSTPGQPLDTQTRSFMEPRFGQNFGKVQVHTDAKAAESARAVNARAFTIGRDIVFGDGYYAPSTPVGKRLLAHELTHVIQQRSLRSPSYNESSIGFALLQMQPIQSSSIPIAAAAHAESMRNQSDPKIWFDSWNNDKRDNNVNGKYDDEDQDEMKCKDGDHYNGGSTWTQGAKIRHGFRPFGWEETVPSKSIMYKVCVDIVTESYKSAGYNFGGFHSVSILEAHCRSNGNFRTWRSNYPDLLPGDIITYKVGTIHSHSGIVGPNGSIIHLPGPSNWIYFSATADNDMQSTWQLTWRNFFGITQVSRYIDGASRQPPKKKKKKRGKQACIPVPPTLGAMSYVQFKSISAEGRAEQFYLAVSSVSNNYLQRTIGDGHDLTSPRFSGDPILEACYDDEARLTTGARGESVRKVQQALIDLGYYLGPAGADGIYGDFTWNAVKQFKANENLGWEHMGDVGPGTMRRLDELFSKDLLPPCTEDEEQLES